MNELRFDPPQSGAELPPSYVGVFLAPEDPTIFRDVTWHSVLVPHALHLESHVAEALFAAIALVGDRTVTVTDIESIPSYRTAQRIAANAGALQALQSETILGHVDTRVVGDSGDWGAEAAHEGLLLLGGTDEFLGAFLGEAGGVDTLRNRYDRYMRYEWVEPLEAAAKLRAAVRWPRRPGRSHGRPL